MAELTGLLDTGRAILGVGGADAREWLQSLVTNDVTRLCRQQAVYAAMLSPQGKYLFDFFLVEGSGGDVLIDVAADRAAALAQRLSLYRLRRAVTLAPAPDMRVALVWGDAASAPTAPGGALTVADPRDAQLGWRIYGARAAEALSGLAPASAADRDALRVACAVPRAGVELIPDESYILEAGFDRLNGVDFRKGCYVGQEVTARMRHKTELRKGLARVRVEGAPPPPGTPLTSADGREAGALRTVVGGAGLAHLRFDRAEGPMTAGEAVVTREG